MQHALDRAVVHLEAGVFGARQVHGFCWVRLDDAADRRAGLGEFKVMPRHLHWHALLKVAIGALEDAQLHEFV